MEVVHLKSLEELLAQSTWSVDKMLYRGVSNESYELVPTIGRVKSVDENCRMHFERNVFEEFKRRAIPYLSRIPTTDFDWLYLARHYGVPTRLLDWTTNPLVAAFFAASEDKDTDFAVYRRLQTSWMTPTSKMNPLEPLDPESDLQPLHGFLPSHADQRFINQSGAFTLHCYPTQAIDGSSVTKYVLPASARSRVQWQVRKYGITHSFIYASLDGLAKDVVASAEYKLNGGSFDSTGLLK